jgi:hypothetical protein
LAGLWIRRIESLIKEDDMSEIVQARESWWRLVVRHGFLPVFCLLLLVVVGLVMKGAGSFFPVPQMAERGSTKTKHGLKHERDAAGEVQGDAGGR